MGGFSYNTNGFAFHRLEDAVRLLAEAGYDGVALTPDVHHLDPLRSTDDDVERMRDQLGETGLWAVIETGARFVLDPARKHRPTLLDAPPEAARRRAFLERCVDLAEALGAPVVSVWSGAAPEGLTPQAAFARLVTGLHALCTYAQARRVRIGFEPEPGMLVERAADWPRVRDAVAHPALGLTLDVGHCLAMREGPPETWIRTHAKDLLVVQLDDHRAGVHDHLMFGEGEVDLAAVARAIDEVGFRGPLEVELSRHSATAPATARAAREHLRQAFGR
jgi:sugar phosphate isomerase/epimerase